MKKLLADHGFKTKHQFFLYLLELHSNKVETQAVEQFGLMRFSDKKEFLYCILFDGCESTKEQQEFFFNLL
jgi:hypothetical protein